MESRNCKLVCRLVLVVSLSVSGTIAAEPVSEGLGSVVDGNTIFAVNLYHQMARGEGNIFFSPHSLSTVLTMTGAGARGATAEQMAGVLELSLGQEELHPAVAALNASLVSAGADGVVELRVASSLWPQQGAPFLESYLDLTRRSYGAEITALDFARATEQGRLEINRWVAAVTGDRIEELILPGQLDPETMMVLVNAVAFRGTWARQFDPTMTSNAVFTRSDGSTIRVPTMYSSGPLRYRQADDAEVVELPFAGERLSMFIVLPAEAEGLAGLEDDLTVESLESWLGAMVEQELRLYLPRLDIKWGTEGLRDELVALGMTDAFDGARADFSGMTGVRGLFIDDVFHQAVLTVDETGAEAAAGSAVVMKKGAMPPAVRVNRPFLLVIRDKPTGSILFMGRVADPTPVPGLSYLS